VYLAEEIREHSQHHEQGWGYACSCLHRQCRIDNHNPARNIKQGRYLLPVKASIRIAERLQAGDTRVVEMRL